MKNILIIATASAVPGLAQLPKALAGAGFDVGAVAPEGALVLATRYLSVGVALPGALDVRSFLDAMLGVMRLWPYDMVMPGDDWAVRYLHQIARLADEGKIPEALAAVVRRSVAPAPHRVTIEGKSGLLAFAASLGIATPPQIRPTSDEAVRAFCRAQGMPVVLKSDLSTSGVGVLVIDDVEEAVRTARGRQGDVRVPWAPEVVAVQRFIPGRPVSVALACRDGAVLATFCYAAERCNPEPVGAATVIRILARPDLLEIAGRLTGALGLSGIVGVDFVVEEDGTPWLLELNPRPPQTAHLGALAGADLCAALAGRAPAGSAGTGAGGREGTLIALFPGEWARDADSPYLQSALHPVPWEDVGLMTAIVDRQATARRGGKVPMPATVSFRLAPSLRDGGAVEE